MHQNIITNPVQLRLETFGFMEQSRCTEEKQNFYINWRKFACRQIPPELIKRADRRPASLKAKSSRLRWWMEIKAVPTVLLQEHTLSPNRPSILCDVDTWALRLLACLLQTPRHLYLITRFNWPPDSANTLTSTCKHTHRAQTSEASEHKSGHFHFLIKSDENNGCTLSKQWLYSCTDPLEELFPGEYCTAGRWSVVLILWQICPLHPVNPLYLVCFPVQKTICVPF